MAKPDRMFDKFSPMSFFVYISPRDIYHQLLNFENLNTQEKTSNFVHISPVNSSSGLNLHPIQGKVDLPYKGGHSLQHSVGHTEHHARLLPHYPRREKNKTKQCNSSTCLKYNRKSCT